MKNELWERLDDAFEPTPEKFHNQVERELFTLRAQEAGRTSHRPLRWAVALAAAAVLLAGTALALNRLGVLDFLTGRVVDGPGRESVEAGTVTPVSQSCESRTLKMTARDAYMDGETLAVCVHIEPAEPAACRLLSETDIGTDGETFDRIWWDGEILTFDEWLPEGKKMLVVSPKRMEIGGERALMSQDWLPDEQGETFLFQTDLWWADDRTALLNDDGTLTVRVLVLSRIYGEEAEEVSTLSMTLPVPDGFLKEE